MNHTWGEKGELGMNVLVFLSSLKRLPRGGWVGRHPEGPQKVQASAART